MTTMCLLHYAAHVLRGFRGGTDEAQLKDTIDALEVELNAERTEHSLLRLENILVREFVSQPEVSRAMALLLRRFLPNASEGIAAYVECVETRPVVKQQRGMSTSCSACQLEFDRELLGHLERDGVVVLESPHIYQSQLIRSITPADRSKIRQLYLLAVGAPGQATGVLLTTQLYPVSAPKEQQVELAQRVTQIIGVQMQRSAMLERHASKLRTTSEMLELRSIADNCQNAANGTLDTFLKRLAELIGADRAALFIHPGQTAPAIGPLVRCGIDMPIGAATRWSLHEDLLASAARHDTTLRRFDTAELKQVGVDCLIVSAIAAPLCRGGKKLGTVYLTFGRPEAISAEKESLLEWATEHLTETLSRLSSHAAVERLARIDGLTHVANRRTFDCQVGREIESATRSSTPCSLLLLDIDRFKSINDTYGHQAGDEVLRSVATIMSEQISRCVKIDRALVARYGGEEFVILLPQTNVRTAGRIAETIRATIDATSIACLNHELQVSISIGVASCPQHGRTVESVIAAADAALYEAKQSGRNRVCVTSESLV